MSGADADPYKAKNLDESVPMDQRITDLLDFTDKAKFCMLTTITPEGHLASRAMALAGKEDNGTTLLFHINANSGKTADLSSHSDVNIAFLTPSGEWASISGQGSVTTDRTLVDRFYSPALKAWIGDLGDGIHDGGPKDPRIGMITVKAKTASYSLARQGILGRAIQVAKGVAQGDVAAVSILRGVTETEFREWAEAET